MPSHLHEVLIEMFRGRPALAAELLGGPLHVAVPDFHAARLSSGELTDVAPTEYRADAVVTLDGGQGGTVLAVVVDATTGRPAQTPHLAGVRRDPARAAGMSGGAVGGLS